MICSGFVAPRIDLTLTSAYYDISIVNNQININALINTRSRIIFPLRGTALLLIICRGIRTSSHARAAFAECIIRWCTATGSPPGRVVSDTCDMNNSIDFAALRLDINRYESLP